MVAANGIDLQFSDYAIDFLAENGFDVQFGARPLKRLIQKEIVNQLSKGSWQAISIKPTPYWWMYSMG